MQNSTQEKSVRYQTTNRITHHMLNLCHIFSIFETDTGAIFSV